jgi:hypothetical protein
MIGMCHVLHMNQNMQTNIKAYHGAIKQSLKHDSRGTKGWWVNELVWQLINFMSLHYLHVQKTKIMVSL